MTAFPVTVVFDGMQRDINDVRKAKEYIVRFKESVKTLENAVFASENAEQLALADDLKRRLENNESLIAIYSSGHMNFVHIGYGYEIRVNSNGELVFGLESECDDRTPIMEIRRFHFDAPPELLYENKRLTAGVPAQSFP